jgi:hypothetical protein
MTVNNTATITLELDSGAKFITRLTAEQVEAVMDTIYPKDNVQAQAEPEIHTGPDGYSEYVPTLSDKLADLGEE